MTSQRGNPTNPIAEMVEGLVVRAEQYGFLLEGREGWLRPSRYAETPVTLPVEGARVRAGLDRSGFVRAVEVLAPPADGGRDVRQVSETGEGYSGGAGGFGSAHLRDTRIMRQAVLNTAVAILSSGGREVEPEQVFELAARLEDWVSR